MTRAAEKSAHTHTSGYDLIGDIHGHADELKRLLSELGYQKRGGAWRHASRRAVFLGDLIDRGPQQREVINVVRSMVEGDAALICMGNHELNAIGYATASSDESGEYLRRHSAKNYLQHDAFLSEFLPHSMGYREVIQWFCQIPLWLELETSTGARARVIHACWDNGVIERVKPYLQRSADGSWILGERFDHRLYQHGTEIFRDVELLLKGPEVRLPRGQSFRDKSGIERFNARVQWWSPAQTWAEAAILGGGQMRDFDMNTPISSELLKSTYQEEIPVFVGHYWMSGDLSRLTERVACLDWSVAKGGRLVAYRWDGEQKIDNDKFVSVWSRYSA